MKVERASIGINAESQEKALEKLEEKITQDEDWFNIVLHPRVEEFYLRDKDGELNFSGEDDDIWVSTDFLFTVSDYDKDLAKSIYELMHGDLEEQAKSFKPDDRGRITLGSNYSDKDEVQVIVLE